jgi:hypothetical protein
LLSVESEADVILLGDLLSATNGSIDQIGRLSVTGSGSTVQQRGNSIISLGAAANSTGIIEVIEDGLFSTGTGLTTIHATGLIDVNGGTYEANGDIDLSGGTIQVASGQFRTASAGISIAGSGPERIDVSGGTFRASQDATISGIDVNFTGDSQLVVDSGATLTFGAGSEFDMRNLQTIDAGTLRIEGGTFRQMHPNSILVIEANGSFEFAGGEHESVAGSQFILRDGGTALWTGNSVVVDNVGIVNDPGSLLTVEGFVITPTRGVFQSALAITNGGEVRAESFQIGGSTEAFMQVIGNAAMIQTSADHSVVVNAISSGFVELSVQSLSVARFEGNLEIASFSSDEGAPIGHVTVEILNASNLTLNRNLVIADKNAEGLSGEIFVGSASSITQNGDGGIVLGNSNNAGGTIRVFSAGHFTSGTGDIVVNPTGLIDVDHGDFRARGDVFLNGGTLRQLGPSNAGPGDVTIDGATVHILGGTLSVETESNLELINGGSINYVFGTLERTGDVEIVSGGTGLVYDFFGEAPTLTAGEHFAVTGNLTLTDSITIDGGTLSAGRLSRIPLLDFQRGTLNLTQDDVRIGAGGLFGATLDVADNKTILVTNTATVDANALVFVRDGGAFGAGTLDNHGEIQLRGGTARLNGTDVSNHGFLTGEGRIDAMLTNQAGGEVRAGRAARLVFTAAGNTNEGVLNSDGGQIDFLADLTNRGNVTVLDGGLKVSGPVTNAAGATINGHDATLRFDGNLTNAGSISFSVGASQVFGDVDNQASGRIGVGGLSIASFFGNVANDGEIDVARGSRVVILGDASGGGDYPGEGEVEFLGALRPGNSPGEVHFGGDVRFGPSSLLAVEIGGLTPGSNYDRITVAGHLSANGELVVRSIDDFEILPGDRFIVVTYDSRDGVFIAEADGTPLGLEINVGYDDVAGAITISASGIGGDANLDGMVNEDDLTILAEHWKHDGLDRGWLSGDFNDDGLVNLIDLVSMAGNWRTGVANPSPEPLDTEAFLAQMAVVPEPGSSGLMETVARKSGVCYPARA